jgi:hypothetical protein
VLPAENADSAGLNDHAAAVTPGQVSPAGLARNLLFTPSGLPELVYVSIAHALLQPTAAPQPPSATAGSNEAPAEPSAIADGGFAGLVTQLLAGGPNPAKPASGIPRPEVQGAVIGDAAVVPPHAATLQGAPARAAAETRTIKPRTAKPAADVAASAPLPAATALPPATTPLPLPSAETAGAGQAQRPTGVEDDAPAKSIPAHATPNPAISAPGPTPAPSLASAPQPAPETPVATIAVTANDATSAAPIPALATGTVLPQAASTGHASSAAVAAAPTTASTGNSSAVTVHLTPAGGGTPSRVTVKLSPAELGDVTFELRRTGAAHDIRVLFERPETLALFQQDRSHLEAALARAGVTGDSTQMTLGLASRHEDSASTISASPSGSQLADAGADSSSQRRPSTLPPRDDPTGAAETSDPGLAPEIPPRGILLRGALDILA